MRTLYIIFSVVGWAWLIVAFAYLWWRTRADRQRARAGGFEVVRHDAK